MIILKEKKKMDNQNQEKSKFCKIYALASSENSSQIRYIGKTVETLKCRLSRHLCYALKYKKNNHKCNWIKNVLANGFEIKIILIGEVYGDGCKEEISY